MTVMFILLLGAGWSCAATPGPDLQAIQPEAVIGYAVTISCGPPAVQFSSHAQLDPQWFNYNWGFGDGTSSTEQDPLHFYPVAAPVDYDVFLTITGMFNNLVATDHVVVHIAAFGGDCGGGGGTTTTAATTTTGPPNHTVGCIKYEGGSFAGGDGMYNTPFAEILHDAQGDEYVQLKDPSPNTNYSWLEIKAGSIHSTTDPTLEYPFPVAGPPGYYGPLNSTGNNLDHHKDISHYTICWSI